jgi:hypothetical protein
LAVDIISSHEYYVFGHNSDLTGVQINSLVHELWKKIFHRFHIVMVESGYDDILIINLDNKTHGQFWDNFDSGERCGQHFTFCQLFSWSEAHFWEDDFAFRVLWRVRRNFLG